MSKFKIDPGDGGKPFVINQGISEILKGLEMDDLTRISAYRGNDEGLHTGTNSPTKGRHGTPFKPLLGPDFLIKPL